MIQVRDQNAYDTGSIAKQISCQFIRRVFILFKLTFLILCCLVTIVYCNCSVSLQFFHFRQRVQNISNLFRGRSLLFIHQQQYELLSRRVTLQL